MSSSIRALRTKTFTAIRHIGTLVVGVAIGKALCKGEVGANDETPAELVTQLAAAHDRLREHQRLEEQQQVQLPSTQATLQQHRSRQQQEALTQESFERLMRKMRKYKMAAQERVHWDAAHKEMLGLTPRLWLEVLDDRHRYASILYKYFRRWQLSETPDGFFQWLDKGSGSLIDLPEAPRRLLDEWNVIYLSIDQQPLFCVQIEPETGRFVWEADGKPVTLSATLSAPQPSRGPQASLRERDVVELLRPSLEKAKRRDDLLTAALEEAARAKAAGEEATQSLLAKLAKPLVKEGLLCRLRDPFFSERLDAATTPGGHLHLRTMRDLPLHLLPGVTWDDFIEAVKHDQGEFMKATPIQLAKVKGIFILDSFGNLYCGTKIRGVFHHSSFVRGHCVMVAGGIKIADGWLQELSPHSGHYQPGEEHFNNMLNDWRERGVDFANVKMRPFVKEK